MPGMELNAGPAEETGSPVAARRRTGRRLPLPIVALAAVALTFFALPFLGLVWRAPWSDAWALLGTSELRHAFVLSVECSLWATGLSVVFGVPLAWVLAVGRFPGRDLLRALCMLSMVLPPVVGGIALFFALGRRGLVGQHLDAWFGVTLPFTTTAVVVAQTFVAMPFLVVTAEAALRQLDPRLEEAARSLGASPWYAFRRVTLRAVAPSLVAGAALAWARALGEFGATVTFAGTFPGTTRTLPLLAYLRLETDPAAAIVISLVLVAVSFAVLVALRGRWLQPLRPPRL
jgi:molybdate transport system permease protein